jgi:hypothetical protein
LASHMKLLMTNDELVPWGLVEGQQSPDHWLCNLPLYTIVLSYKYSTLHYSNIVLYYCKVNIMLILHL